MNDPRKKEDKDVGIIFEMLAEHDNEQNTANGKASTISIFTRMLFPVFITTTILMSIGDVTALVGTLSALASMGVGILWAIIHDRTCKF